ncbi:YbgA family protein, partial [Myxococcota bacterium]|nr:YbgA family protein [Myxococcota bacterium]MBU1534750.1 YbgA family protein [Myxococcota bacterium]
NVLQHIAGYFKRSLSKDEKAEVQEIIAQYHDGLIPLIVPITLLTHFVRKYGESYLANQLYLNPHPKELMLRNHW